MALECPKSLIQITADSHFTARDDATQTTSTAITLLACNEMKRVNDGGTATESAKLLSDDDDENSNQNLVSDTLCDFVCLLNNKFSDKMLNHLQFFNICDSAATYNGANTKFLFPWFFLFRSGYLSEPSEISANGVKSSTYSDFVL